MSRLSIVSASHMIKILKKIGFLELRQKGSHLCMKHTDGRLVVIPLHGEDLGRGLIRKILRDIELSVEDYENLRRSI